MSRIINVSDSVSLIPSGYDSANSDYYSVNSSYPISNGYDGTSSSDYAYIQCNTGSRADTYISYTFNVNSIPSNATIDSVECSAKVRVSSTSYISSAVLQLYSGSTAKGSSVSARTTSASVYDIDYPGSWTRSELNNIEIRYTGTRGTSNTNRGAYLYFYGATLIVNYSISGTAYTITATSAVPAAPISPASQEVLSGEDAQVRIDANDLGDIIVTDNGVDVSSSFVKYHVPTGGTVEKVPESYSVSGSVSGTRYQHTVGCGVDNHSSQTGNDYCSSGSSATIYYHFNFDEIPDDAIISDMTVQAYGHLESTSNSSEIAELNTYYGTTAKGTVTEYTSTSSQLRTIPAGNWTVEQLKEDARVGFTIGYYGGLTTGITWTVEYTVPSTGSNYYYIYTVNNVSDDHVILVEENGPFIPPEEDETKTYWPVTISSINATTNPMNGTTRVVEGSNQIITITPTDPQLTLALDNGVDITSQLQGGVPNNTYTIDTQVSGADYGFSLNNSTGYYISSNDGVSKSASVARLNMNFESDCLVTIQYINYAEEDYDYGMFGKLDVEVATDGLTAGQSGSSPSDSTSNYQIARCTNSTSTQTVTYEVPFGEHFIDIKYGKDDASDSGNDNLQWKVLKIEATSTGGDYTYTLNNINQKHSLIFVFGDVTFYYITSSGTSDMKLFPDGQQVKLEDDIYLLNIVPNHIDSTIKITDNNTDVTTQLEKETGVDKKNNSVVSYKYRLKNISENHTISVSAEDGGLKIFVKENGSWRTFSTVYKKINGVWVVQNDWSNVFNADAKYVTERIQRK